MSYTNNEQANMREVDLAKTIFDYSNLKDTALEGSNVWKTRFKKALKLNPFSLLKTRNAESLVFNTRSFNSAMQDMRQQNRTVLTPNELAQIFTEKYLSDKHRQVLLPLITQKVLAQKALLDAAPNAFWKTLPNYIKNPAKGPKQPVLSTKGV
jgi:Pentapeptide repeats (8 copies)